MKRVSKQSNVWLKFQNNSKSKKYKVKVICNSLIFTIKSDNNYLSDFYKY